jgi:MerR family transcriptional regulator, mercuric resistance operon regulatory protein
MQEGMTIGRLAKAAGVNVETIRYYQRRGLIAEPHKPLGGHRRYPSRMVLQLGFIRRAQQLGFSLEEVRSLLRHADGRSPRETRAIAQRKYEVLESRIAELGSMRRKLKAMIAASSKPGAQGDPIIAALSTAD